MKITVHLLVLIIGIFFNSEICLSQVLEKTQSKPADGKNTNRSAIDFQAIDLKGQAFKAESLKGKSVLIDFWAIWCAPCIAAFPTLKKLNKDLSGNNFEVVGIAAYSGTAKDVSKFVEKHGLDYRVLVGDSDLVERFGVIGYPTYFLISPDGKIHKKYVGEVKNLYSEVKKVVLELQKKRSGK